MAASKRSKLQPSWIDVFENIEYIADECKPSIANIMAKFVTTMEFFHQNQNIRQLICKAAQVEEFEEDVFDMVEYMIEGPPSPSNMKYEHVGLILEGQVSCSNGLGELKECVLSTEERESLIAMYSAVDQSCINTDASIRVTTLVIALAKHLKITFSTQPSMENQTANNGSSIHISSEMETALIEIKKSATYCDLLLEDDDTAQALRQAYLTLQTRLDRSRLLLIITNSRGWSFGLVKREKEKIKVTSTAHFDIHNEEQIVHIYAMLKHHVML